jgi:hypothetical protein
MRWKLARVTACHHIYFFRRNACQEGDRTLPSGFATNVKSSPFGLTRKIPSDRIGTQQSVISRLEDAD